MINKNFWDLLAEKQDSLTKSGTIIADYLTKHAEEAQFLSISSLAKACNMAEATIYRFCKQLGFEGYNEMKFYFPKFMRKKNTRQRMYGKKTVKNIWTVYLNLTAA